MPSVNFSLTENWIINPVLTLSAPVDPKAHWCRKIVHCIEAHFCARFLAIFTSVFSAADCFIHLLVGGAKAGYLLLSKCCKCLPAATWNGADVATHFKQVGKFTFLTAFGSTVGVVYPRALAYFRQNPIQLPDTDDDFPSEQADQKAASSRNPFTDIPEALFYLASIARFNAVLPVKELKAFWKSSSLLNKHRFVQLFNSDSDKFANVRNALGKTVYRPIDPTIRNNVKWLSPKEIHNQSAIGEISWGINTFTQAKYFHATPRIEGLESILKTKKVEVRHEKVYRGAFVSTRPEANFGKYILAFKSNIERLSSLSKGFSISKDTYWAGFSSHIPVTKQTLAYVILEDGDEKERSALEANCQTWARRDVKVILRSNIERTLQAVNKLNLGIPEEWPDEGEAVGLLVLNHFRPKPQAVAAHAHAYAHADVLEHADAHAEQAVEQRPPLLRARSYAPAGRQQLALAMG